MSVQQLSFVIEGEGLTQIARDAFASDLISKSVKILTEGLGMSVSQAFKVLTGEYKLIGSSAEGDGTLEMVKDLGTSSLSKEWGMDMSIHGKKERLEKSYIKTFNKIRGEKRTRFLYHGEVDESGMAIKEPVPTAASAHAANWRLNNFGKSTGRSKPDKDINSDKVNKLSEDLKGYQESLSFIYQETGDDIFEFVTRIATSSAEWDDLSEVEIEKIKLESKFAEEEREYRKRAKEEKEKEEKKKEKKKNEEDVVNKAIELHNKTVQEFIESTKNSKFLSGDDLIEHRELDLNHRNLSGLQRYDSKVDLLHPGPAWTNPETTEAENAYIGRDGRFYPTSLQGHLNLERLFECAGIYPELDDWSKGFMDVGLCKISSRDVMLNVHDVKPTEELLETLSTYLLTRDWEYFTFFGYDRFKDPLDLINHIREDAKL